ncbi:MAG: hypothetical protein ACXITV_11020 [Luteibaculaceae bacterium]
MVTAAIINWLQVFIHVRQPAENSRVYMDDFRPQSPTNNSHKTIMAHANKRYLRIFSILLCLLAPTIALKSSIFAQQNRSTDYLVLVSNDTLFGQVEHINTRGVSPKYLKKIQVKPENGRRKRISRKSILAFKSDGEEFERFYLAQNSGRVQLVNLIYKIDTKRGEQFFLKVMNRHEALNHYQMQWWEQGSSTQLSMDLFKKSSDNFLIRANQGLLGLNKRALTNYFSDCKPLQSAIQEDSLKTARAVFNFYTVNCGKL